MRRLVNAVLCVCVVTLFKLTPRGAVCGFFRAVGWCLVLYGAAASAVPLAVYRSHRAFHVVFSHPSVCFTQDSSDQVYISQYFSKYEPNSHKRTLYLIRRLHENFVNHHIIPVNHHSTSLL